MGFGSSEPFINNRGYIRDKNVWVNLTISFCKNLINDYKVKYNKILGIDIPLFVLG